MVQGWIAATPENTKQFEAFEWLWQQGKRVAADSTVDTDAAWANFVKLKNKQEKHAAKPIPIQRSFSWMQIAAACVLLIGLAVVIRSAFIQETPIQFVAVYAGQTPRIDTLDDGSFVTLNKNSSLEKPEHFSANERRIKLDGEAFFEVKANKEKPFIIHAGRAEVQVLGTSFNVKSTATALEVIVETGLVQVLYGGNKLLVKPQEKLTVNTLDSSYKIESQTDKLHQYYRTKVFVCDDTRLQDLVKVLSEAYDKPIILENSAIANLRISTTFNNESLDTILEIIAQTLEVTYAQKQDTIVIK